MALVTTRAITEGEELFISYGSRLSNDALLLNYGFLEQPNVHDTLDLVFSPELAYMGRKISGLSERKMDMLLPFQTAALEELSLEDQPVSLGGLGLLDGRLLAALRVLSATSAEHLGGHSVAELRGLDTVPGLAAVVEQEAWYTAIGITAYILARFPTMLVFF